MSSLINLNLDPDFNLAETLAANIVHFLVVGVLSFTLTFLGGGILFFWISVVYFLLFLASCISLLFVDHVPLPTPIARATGQDNNWQDDD